MVRTVRADEPTRKPEDPVWSRLGTPSIAARSPLRRCSARLGVSIAWIHAPRSETGSTSSPPRDDAGIAEQAASAEMSRVRIGEPDPVAGTSTIARGSSPRGTGATRREHQDVECFASVLEPSTTGVEGGRLRNSERQTALQIIAPAMQTGSRRSKAGSASWRLDRCGTLVTTRAPCARTSERTSESEMPASVQLDSEARRRY